MTMGKATASVDDPIIDRESRFDWPDISVGQIRCEEFQATTHIKDITFADGELTPTLAQQSNASKARLG